MEINNQVYRWGRSLLIRAGSHLPEPFGADDAGHRGADRFSGETVDRIPVQTPQGAAHRGGLDHLPVGGDCALACSADSPPPGY